VLLGILAEPSVRRWWGTYDRAMLDEDLPTALAIEIGGAVAGWLLVNEEPDPYHRHVAFDIALASSFQGRGYGPEALRLVIRHYIGQGHHRFTLDPDVHNERAIRSYAAVGFKPVGVMRAVERIDDEWRDDLLMDLLAAEFEG